MTGRWDKPDWIDDVTTKLHLGRLRDEDLKSQLTQCENLQKYHLHMQKFFEDEISKLQNKPKSALDKIPFIGRKYALLRYNGRLQYHLMLAEKMTQRIEDIKDHCRNRGIKYE